MKGRKKRTITLAILCCLLVFMGVVYSIFSTRLTIGGTTTAINTWSILIDSITPIENQTSATSISAVVDEVTKTNASFEVDFKKPGDYMEYTVVVKNNGSINGYIDKVNAIMDDPSNPDNRLFKITSDVMPGTSINAGESISFSVKIEFDENATIIPTSGIKFELSAEILQGEGNDAGGNTPGGGGETPDPENDWLFEVDENGEVVAYNYNSNLTQTPQDVVVPSEVNGVPITTITEDSFMPQGNVEAYQTEEPTGMYAIIHESEPAFTNVEKKLVTMLLMQCDGDSTCEQQYKAMLYACTDTNTCYSISNKEQHAVDSSVELVKVSIPDTAEPAGNLLVNPDPDVALEDSMGEPSPNVKTLDLSQATNLTTIESNALSGAGLESVEFGDNSNITSIGNSAFSNNELANVEIPASVETIGDSAFSGNQIETVTFGETTEVQNQLTKNKKYSLSKMGTTLEKMAISNSKLKSIGSYAFRNNKISALELPDSLESLGDYSFSENNISNLTIPKTVISIGDWTFENNLIESLIIEKCTTSICVSGKFGTGIKKLTIGSGEIAASAFSTNSYATVKIQSLVLGEGVTSIGAYAFQNNAITSLTLPNTLTTIGNSAFYNNEINGILIIPSSLTQINENVFKSNNISGLTIPETLTSIKDGAFRDNNITELIIPDTLITDDGFPFADNPIETLTIEQCTTTLCNGTTSEGSTRFGNKIKNLTIESGEIGSGAFQNNSIENLVIPEAVTSIEDDAFEGTSFENLTIEKCTEDICADKRFGNSIGKLEIRSGQIGERAFEAAIITNFIIRENVTALNTSSLSNSTIENLTIEKCTTNLCFGRLDTGLRLYFDSKINNLTIETGEIGDAAFYGRDYNKLVSLTLGSGVTSIGYAAFENNAIKQIIIPKTVTEIPSSAFQHNLIEGQLLIPNTINSIGASAFSGNLINSVVFEEDSKLTSIGDGAFDNNQISGTLKLPSVLSSVESFAFRNNQIVNLIIPASVTSIEYAAFYDNPTLQSILIKRTEEDFLNNVTDASSWYDNTLSPTITYDPS